MSEEEAPVSVTATAQTDSVKQPINELLIAEDTDRSDGSDSGLGSDIPEVDSSEQCSENESTELPESTAPTAEKAYDDDAGVNGGSGKAEDSGFPIETPPVLDDLKVSGFEELRSSVFEDEKESDGPLRTPQPDNEGNGSPDEFIERPLPLPPLPPPPPRGSLKRKVTTDDIPSSLSSPRDQLEDETGESARKKPKRSITFNGVCVYYFPRTQGFTCVPSQGGSTLGMSAMHSHVQQFTLHEHSIEQRRLHKLLLQQARSNHRLQKQRKQAEGEEGQSAQLAQQQQSQSDTEDSESDEEEQSDDEDEDMDLENYYFLQPVPTRQRRALLRASGVRKIDTVERDECRDIRTSREFCGCSCKGFCDPETCSCAQGGIKCQVDRMHFPCGCTRDGCANPSGRIEFNPLRVRTHYIHTIMKIQLENKKNQLDEEAPLALATPDKPVELPPFQFHPPVPICHPPSSPPSSSSPSTNQFPSFSFAQPLGFPHYSQLYSQDITSKELGAGGGLYKGLLCDGFTGDGFVNGSFPVKDQSETNTYTSLHTVCSNSSRLEPFSELLQQARYPMLPALAPEVPLLEQVDPIQDLNSNEPATVAQATEDTPVPPSSEDDSIGVIIKKSMEETVSA